MRGADCSTHHSLICSLCNFHIKPPRRKTGPTPVKKLNVSKLADSKMQAMLMTNMETNMTNLSCDGTINDQWENLCEKMYQTSVDTLGHTARKHQDCLMKIMRKYYRYWMKGVGHMKHCCYNRQEVETSAMQKQNPSYKKMYERCKMPGRTKKLKNCNS